MLAIGVFRSRVAPVLNWCSTIWILPEDAADGSRAIEVSLPQEGALHECVRVLAHYSVQVLICGALSPDLLCCAEHLGIRVIHGVAGEVNEVLAAYGADRLDDPRFRLPGCRCPRRYRQGGPGGPRGRACRLNAGDRDATDLQRSPRDAGGKIGGAAGSGAGPGGTCVCPECGETQPHRRGIPCSLLTCPQCGRSMTRG